MSMRLQELAVDLARRIRRTGAVQYYRRTPWSTMESVCWYGLKLRLRAALDLGNIIMASKVWFITGTSKGFGRVWAEAVLARGDRVAATARQMGTLAPLLERYGKQVATIALDVTDKGAVAAAIAETHGRFGRLDVVINNAGYGLFGTIEEVSEAEARAQIETNLFGALWVTQAALPIMRTQGSGHIIQISSLCGA